MLGDYPKHHACVLNFEFGVCVCACMCVKIHLPTYISHLFLHIFFSIKVFSI